MKFVLFTSFLCVNSAVRDKLLGLLTGVSEQAFKEEPGVHKFAMMTLQDDPQDRMLYSLEEYANQTTFQTHLNKSYVSSMFQWIRSNDVYENDPAVSVLDGVEELEFSKPEVANGSSPYIVVDRTSYPSGTLDGSMKYWQDLVTQSKNETGTLMFAVYTDPANATTSLTVGVFQDLAYLQGVHGKSSASAASEEHLKSISATSARMVLRMKGGYLYKG